MTRIIKKYPNRRLYDTETSTYITLAEIKQFVLEYQDFQVQDARSGEDLTRSILLQIILEEESGGVPMFSGDMLANVIRYYGHSMQGLMGNYLERSIHAFHEAQQKFQDSAKKLVVGDYPKFGPDACRNCLIHRAPACKTCWATIWRRELRAWWACRMNCASRPCNCFPSRLAPYPVHRNPRRFLQMPPEPRAAPNRLLARRPAR